MMEYHHSSDTSHPYSASCGYCHHDEITHYTFGEDSSMTSPLFINTIVNQPKEEPYRYNYLLNLMTAPDMSAYLSVANDDIYALPIHLQKLIIEAKEEIVLKHEEKPAQIRLQKVRNHIWRRADGDFAILMNMLIELVSDEDELEDLLRM
ncbi:hypothetical protein V8B55DRAFT_1457539 [Mucor lusitanicus]|nr:hypothetical protein FB192DRAFT_1350915 [Mucor lusitanicus]